MINIEDFRKLEIRIGKVVSAEKVEGADKLLKLEVDFGPAVQNSTEQGQDENDHQGSKRIIRQILSGIAEYYAPESIIGKEFPFIVNLEPRIIRGVESQGMIIAVCSEETVSLLQPDKEVEPGSIVR